MSTVPLDRRAVVSPLLAFTWIAVGALLLRIAVAGRFNDLASGPVGRSGMVAFVGLLLPALGLLAAAAIPRVDGAWPLRLSQGVGVAVTILGGGLLIVGHGSAWVVAALGFVGCWIACPRH